MILYVKNNCSACKNVEDYFNDKAIDFDEINIQRVEGAAIELLDAGIRSVPTLKMDDEYIVGSENIKSLF